MLLTSRTLAVALPVALLLLAACATGGGKVAPEEEVSITVENEFFPRTDLTVRIVTPTGLLQVLGSVPPGGSRTLRYDRRLYQDFYQLVAETARGESFSSQPFIMFPGARVNWSLPTNSLNVFARDGG